MTLRALAFGEAGIGIWGVAWSLGDGGPAFTAVGAREGAEVLEHPASLELSDDAWWLASEDLELEAGPEGEAAALAEGFDQPVRVSGRLRAAGADHEVDSLGTRASRDAADPSGLDSIRGLAAWFGPDLGLSVLSLRPRGATGHDRDSITASLFEQGHPLTVEEARLSTTYTAEGVPARAGVELWLAPGEAEVSEGEQEPPEPRPRRAAGESIGPIASGSAGELDVHAGLFRCHAEGREGSGVYVLARTR
jgi:hypothetical protein